MCLQETTRISVTWLPNISFRGGVELLKVEAETIIGLFSKNETLTQGLSSARERAGEAGRGCVGGSPKLDAQEAATKRPADERPRNPSGKVLKRQLRKPYWEAKRRRIN